MITILKIIIKIDSKYHTVLVSVNALVIIISSPVRIALIYHSGSAGAVEDHITILSQLFHKTGQFLLFTVA